MGDGENLGSCTAWLLLCTIKSLKLLRTRLPPVLPLGVQNCPQVFRGTKWACKGSSPSGKHSLYFCTAQCPPQHIYHLPLHLFLILCLSSLLTAYLQQPSKNRPKGMSQARSSSHHFICDCLFNLVHLKGGGQKAGCVLGSISGGTKNWERCFFGQQEGNCKTRSAPYTEAAQLLHSTYLELWAEGKCQSVDSNEVISLSFLNLYWRRLLGRAADNQEQNNGGWWKQLSLCLTARVSQI